MRCESEPSLAPSLSQRQFPCVAVFGEHGVRLLAHQRNQLVPVGDVDRLDRHVSFGVAAAVPVEIVTALAPAPPVEFRDRHHLV